jgi:hypothetical protein
MAQEALQQPQQQDCEPLVERRSVKALALLSLKRTYDLFATNHGDRVPADEGAQRVRLSYKVCLNS